MSTTSPVETSPAPSTDTPRTADVLVATAAPMPSRADLLGGAAAQRWQRLHRAQDRDRLFTGMVLRRLAMAEVAGRDVPLRRHCRGCGANDHGEVQPARAQDRDHWRLSLSHAGSRVVLAVATLGAGAAPAEAGVGVDIEAVARLRPEMARFVLAATEQERLGELSAAELCTMWTAKEAVLKALGVGLQAAMTGIDLGWDRHGPGARVRATSADPLLDPLRSTRCSLVPLTTDAPTSAGSAGDAHYRSWLAVLGADEVRVRQREVSAAELEYSLTPDTPAMVT